MEGTSDWMHMLICSRSEYEHTTQGGAKVTWHRCLMLLQVSSDFWATLYFYHHSRLWSVLLSDTWWQLSIGPTQTSSCPSNSLVLNLILPTECKCCNCNCPSRIYDILFYPTDGGRSVPPTGWYPLTRPHDITTQTQWYESSTKCKRLISQILSFC